MALEFAPRYTERGALNTKSPLNLVSGTVSCFFRVEFNLLANNLSFVFLVATVGIVSYFEVYLIMVCFGGGSIKIKRER